MHEVLSHDAGADVDNSSDWPSMSGGTGATRQTHDLHMSNTWQAYDQRPISIPA